MEGREQTTTKTMRRANVNQKKNNQNTM